MNYLDIVIAIILFFFGFKGFRKGFIIEVVTLLAFGVGIYGAMHFSDFTASHLQEVIEIDPKHLNTAAFILTFVILVVLVHIVGRLVTQAIKAMNLNIFNKVGGALFGLAKGVLLCSLMMMVLTNFGLLGFLKPDVKQSSLMYPYVEKTVPYIYRGFDLMKDYVQEVFPDEEYGNEEETPVVASLLTN